jgi:putative lipoprotein
MRGLLLIFSLHAGPAAPQGAPADAWFSRDKAQHFLMSAFIQSAGYGALRGAGVRHGTALGGASVATAAVGVGKELHDRRVKGDFSARDLTWDAAGAGAMTLLLTHTAR